MGKQSNRVHLVLFLGLLFAVVPIVRSAFAQGKASTSVPKTESRQQLREDQVNKLLQLMDTDKNGKISKKEWMSFMEAEFDRLDKDKTGELTPKELAQSRVQPSSFARVGK
jgi:hypothetical protein